MGEGGWSAGKSLHRSSPAKAGAQLETIPVPTVGGWVPAFAGKERGERAVSGNDPGGLETSSFHRRHQNRQTAPPHRSARCGGFCLGCVVRKAPVPKPIEPSATGSKCPLLADIVDLVGGFAAGRFDWRSVWWWARSLSTAAEPRDALGAMRERLSTPAWQVSLGSGRWRRGGTRRGRRMVRVVGVGRAGGCA
mgnify:CR=1 FL=1